MAKEDSTQHWQDKYYKLIKSTLKANEAPFIQLNATTLLAFPTSQHTFMDLATPYALSSVWTDSLRTNPSLARFATLAYARLKRTSASQSVLISSLSPTQHTLVSNVMMHQVLTVSAKRGRLSKVHVGILKGQLIWQAFGCSLVEAAGKGSGRVVPRSTLVTEVQFSRHGRTVGARWMPSLVRPGYVEGRGALLMFQLLLGDAAWVAGQRGWQLEGEFKLVGKKVTSPLTDLTAIRNAMKTFGMGTRTQKAIFGILAGMLHLGNVEFVAFEGEESCMVSDPDRISLIAEILNVDEDQLLACLTYKTTLLNGSRCTAVLSPEDAARQRDMLIAILYEAMFHWMTEQLNKKLDKRATSPTPLPVMSFLNPIGSTLGRSQTSSLDDFCANYTTERLQHFINKRFIDEPIYRLRRDNMPYHPAHYDAIKDTVALVARGRDCLMALLDNQTKRLLKGKHATASDLLAAYRVMHEGHARLALSPEQESNEETTEETPKEAPKEAAKPWFSITHFHSTVRYDPTHFVEDNAAQWNLDFLAMFSGDKNPNANPILRQICHQHSHVVEATEEQQGPEPEGEPMSPTSHDDDNSELPEEVAVSVTGEEAVTKTEEKKKAMTKVSQFKTSLSDLFDGFEKTTCWAVLCVDPEVRSKKEHNLAHQLRALNVPSIAATSFALDYFISYPFDQFVARYRSLPLPHGPTSTAIITSLVRLNEWSALCPETKTPLATMGNTQLHLSLRTWLELEQALEEVEGTRPKGRRGGDEDTASVVSEALSNVSSHGVEQPMMGEGGMIAADEDGASVAGDIVDELGHKEHGQATLQELCTDLQPKGTARDPHPPTTAQRKQWVCITWLLTWWIPTFCLRCCGMKRADVQMAWREKVALCLLILLLGWVVVFLIAGMGFVFCPPQKVYTLEELGKKMGVKESFVHAYGVVYDVTSFAGLHETIAAVGSKELLKLGGQDVAALFPFEAVSCGETDGERSVLSEVQVMNYNSTETFNVRHPHRRPGKALDMMRSGYFRGDVVFPMSEVKKKNSGGQGRWIVVRDEVFDVTGIVQRSLGEAVLQAMFPGSFGADLLATPSKMDWTDYLDKQPDRPRVLRCLRGIFRRGRLDPRTSVNCLVPNYLLLGATGILLLLMIVKFVAALQFASKRDPEDHDRFVLCMVPCYTEDTDSIRKTIHSLAVTKYDDKRKLLFIICDGNIVGSGNDRPTPLLVLDVLGKDPAEPAPSLSVQALGEGRRQHNMAKVYSGLYQVAGHVVPYVVVVKVGTPDEKRKPGNRGKRDSQLLLMRFLSRVHYQGAMSPLELELYHQIHNVIGVSPSFYEYVLMVDADTQVAPDAINRMVSCFAADAKVMGLCGETKIANEKESWTSMIQVYEYYISHHLSKAFESLFGSVTCLPGCFCMYRIRAPGSGLPLLVHEDIVNLYAENNVNTLHLKNLLHLGEDRYLTTLMLRTFPAFKTIFTQDAACKTNVPEHWSVFLSQRRRWINSTVHNLYELLSLKQLCGCCCFSMRFVVFLDLFATLILPATVIYLAYMIYLLATQSSDTVIVSILLICAVYGLQAIIFLIKRQWQHIAWMFIYIIAIPVFNFYLPLYAFWHFDDFSWGNTRIVIGEAKNNHRDQVLDDSFSIDEILHKKWTDYEAELEKMVLDDDDERHADVKSVASAGSHWSAHSRSVYAGASTIITAPANDDKRYFTFSQHYPAAAGTHITDELAMHVRAILDQADLMKVTKKQIRDQLAQMYQQDLSIYKEFINQCIEAYLESNMSHM